jgi:hypothetical protein
MYTHAIFIRPDSELIRESVCACAKLFVDEGNVHMAQVESWKNKNFDGFYTKTTQKGGFSKLCVKNKKISPLKNVYMPNTSKLLFKSHTAIGFYAKTMSAHGSHLGWKSWSPDTILKVYYPRTIHAMFALNWLTGFRREDF